jgi:phage terminase small subunit
MENAMSALLSFRQERFVFEYLKDQNASAAAARAGYSSKSRASHGRDLMRNTAVRERIRLEMQSLLGELKAALPDLLRERARAAFFRPSRMLKEGWKLRELDEMDEETRAALQVSVTLRKGEPTLRVAQPNREKALAALERVHERLERANERYWERLEREEEASAAPAPPPAPAQPRRPLVTDGDLGYPRLDMWTSRKPADAGNETAEKPEVLSGGATTDVVDAGEAAPQNGEKHGGLSGSAQPDTTDVVKDAAPAARPVEDMPDSLIEHLARVRAGHLDYYAQREIERKHGRIGQREVRPGVYRPPGVDLGYNPPHLRRDRPQYAIGAGECDLGD